ncbi:hypothetical protein BD779DRAFT_1676524 [Infundibulicybe gibba]|nr:hypothetical protein BD779DRAFT_1676524 [Infundibulicybe gibba]
MYYLIEESAGRLTYFVRPIIEDGLIRSSKDANPRSFSSRRQRLHIDYVALTKIAPLIPDLARESGPHGISSTAAMLEKARSAARATDVSSMKIHIHHWRKFDPPINPMQRHTMGFYNNSSGQLLCPAGRDWADSSVQHGLIDGTIEVGPGEFPLFLWKDETFEPTETFTGFLRGDILVKAFLHIFIGPQAAYDAKENHATRKGNAAIHGIHNVTTYSIAYAATIARFVLSNQPTLTAGGKERGRWPYEVFYQELVKTMTEMVEDELDELLYWWDETVFGDIRVEDSDTENTTQPLTSIASTMRAEAAARRQAAKDQAQPARS